MILNLAYKRAKLFNKSKALRLSASPRYICSIWYDWSTRSLGCPQTFGEPEVVSNDPNPEFPIGQPLIRSISDQMFVFVYKLQIVSPVGLNIYIHIYIYIYIYIRYSTSIKYENRHHRISRLPYLSTQQGNPRQTSSKHFWFDKRCRRIRDIG
jgi:hypothetical protein